MNIKDYFKKAKKEVTKSQLQVKKEQKPYFEAIQSFEKGKLDTLKQRVKLLTVLCFAEMAVIGAMSIAIACMAPLKTAVPYVIRVDNNTGYTDVAPTLKSAQETPQEAELKYFLSVFVMNYVGYDWATIQQTANTVETMADQNVFSQFDDAIKSENSPLRILKSKYKVRVRIKSVTLMPANTAQVRFETMILTASGKLADEYPIKNWVATIAYNFKKEIKTEQQRLINPLGFMVTSYKADAEAMR